MISVLCYGLPESEGYIIAVLQKCSGVLQHETRHGIMCLIVKISKDIVYNKVDKLHDIRSQICYINDIIWFEF